MRSQLQEIDQVPRAEHSSSYRLVVERQEELARMNAQAQRRKSMLVFGPQGVGKTRLLQNFLNCQPLALYVRQTTTPRDIMLALIDAIRVRSPRGFRLPNVSATASTNSLKNTVDYALRNVPFLIVLDQLVNPSRVVTGIVKELNYFDRTPVFFAARTPHMEDIGSLIPMCSDRSEKVEVKNFPENIALEFACNEANATGLEATNLNPALDAIVEWSLGNPGSIIEMIKMAHLEKYRMDGQIKTHVLYIDHIMGPRIGKR